MQRDAVPTKNEATRKFRGRETLDEKILIRGPDNGRKVFEGFCR